MIFKNKKYKEPIANQYEKGIVELSSIVEPLIENFKNDKTSLDIQQLQLITHYLIIEREFDENYIDELEKELDEEKEKNKGLIDNSNKLIEVTNLYLDSVPKSKIKEKIKYLKKGIEEIESKDNIDDFAYRNKLKLHVAIFYLKELLEE